MLISPKLLKNIYQIQPKGVLHVGAHDGEEQHDYEKFSWGPVTWIEAMPKKVEQLKHRLEPPHLVIEACVWDSTGTEMVLREANNGQSTSLFKFGTHEKNYPEIEVIKEVTVQTNRLDSLGIDFQAIDFLNLDIQGAELQALRGLGGNLSKISYIYSEVNREEVYVGCSLVADIDVFLLQSGFTRIDTIWTKNGWGDAIWIKSDLVPNVMRIRRFLRRVYTLPQMLMMNVELTKKKLNSFRFNSAN
jgi:FkbM family methyltransferase